ncbi:MAG: hypothetical protein ACOC56_00315 [Atribacterota bacterium]
MKLWFWFNTKCACGAIITNDIGKIIETAPIYRKLIGRNIKSIKNGTLKFIGRD